MSDSNDEHMTGPVESEEEVEEDALWMTKQWLSLATISIVAGVLLVLGLMLVTGPADAPALVGGSPL